MPRSVLLDTIPTADELAGKRRPRRLWEAGDASYVALLSYGNRKTDQYLWIMDSDESEEAAFWELFRILDKDWGVYADLEDVKLKPYTEADYLAGKEPPDMDEVQETILYRAAKNDHHYTALRLLLDLRAGGEYEEWSVVSARRPKKRNHR